MSRAGRLAGLTLLALTAGLLCVLAAEVVLRRSWVYEPRLWFWPGERASLPSQRFLPDSATGWRMRAGVSFDATIGGTRHNYAADAQGFRSEGTCDPARRPAVALVGDSFTFGYGVAAAERWGLHIEIPADSVCNLAMPGFGLDQMWMALRHQALPLRPARVILAFVDDDFERSQTAYRVAEGFAKPMFTREGDSLRPAVAGDAPAPVVRWIKRKSAIWRAGELAIQNAGRQRGRGGWWRLNAAILSAAAADARQAGVQLMVVRLPIQGALPAFVPLARHLDSLGVPLLDLEADASRCQAAADFLSDGHASASGHACIAARVAEWLRDQRSR